MEWKTAILVTDARQRYISDFLPGKKAICEWGSVECQRMLSQANAMILPTPVSKISKSEVNDKLKQYLINCNSLCGGVVTSDWKNWIESRGGVCVDLMEQQTVVEKNAWITAEATVAELLKCSLYSINGLKVMIAGFGHCGKALAHLLSQMGAKITVLARNSQVRKEAKAMGYNAVDFSYAPVEAYGTGALINTVPAMVIGEKILAELQSDAVVIDIASAPGGVDLESAKQYGIQVIQALGLPGKYTVKSSARVLASSIRKNILPQNNVDEGQLWTFQIIL